MYQSKAVSSISPNGKNSLAHDQHLELSDNVVFSNSGRNDPGNPNLASRQRLRWTNELHDRFVDAVTQLGGPESKCMINWFFPEIIRRIQIFLYVSFMCFSP